MTTLDPAGELLRERIARRNAERERDDAYAAAPPPPAPSSGFVALLLLGIVVGYGAWSLLAYAGLLPTPRELLAEPTMYVGAPQAAPQAAPAPRSDATVYEWATSVPVALDAPSAPLVAPHATAGLPAVIPLPNLDAHRLETPAPPLPTLRAAPPASEYRVEAGPGGRACVVWQSRRMLCDSRTWLDDATAATYAGWLAYDGAGEPYAPFVPTPPAGCAQAVEKVLTVERDGLPLGTVVGVGCTMAEAEANALRLAETMRGTP